MCIGGVVIRFTYYRVLPPSHSEELVTFLASVLIDSQLSQHIPSLQNE